MPDLTPVTDPDLRRSSEPYVSYHRWPWRWHEYRAMAVLALACLLAGHLLGSGAEGFAATAWRVAGAAGAVATVGWLWHVGTQRKNRSAVTVEVHGDRLVVRSQGALQTTTARHREAVAVGYRRFGSDETFAIADGGQTVRVPLRATADPHVREAVDAAFGCATRIDPEAHELYSRRPRSRTS